MMVAWVSILVFVELALDGPGIDGHRRDRSGVSILVFVELALDVKPFHGVRCECDSFQSLFSWNLLLMP